MRHSLLSPVEPAFRPASERQILTGLQPPETQTPPSCCGLVGAGRLMCLRSRAGCSYHLVNRLIELVDIRNLHHRRTVSRVAHNVDRRRVFEWNAGPDLTVRFHLGRQFSRWVDYERQRDFVVLCPFFRNSTKVLLGYTELVREDVQTIIVAQLLRLGVEIASVDRGFQGPGMLTQGKVLLHQRDVVFLGRFQRQRRGFGALRTFQVFKDDDSDLRSFGRMQHGGVSAPGQRAA